MAAEQRAAGRNQQARQGQHMILEDLEHRYEKLKNRVELVRSYL